MKKVSSGSRAKKLEERSGAGAAKLMKPRIELSLNGGIGLYWVLFCLGGDRMSFFEGGEEVDEEVAGWECRHRERVGKGRFPACQPLPTGSATSIVAADFDGDGALDLFVPHRDGGQSILPWNDGKGHFPTSTNVGPANAWIRIGAAGDLTASCSAPSGRENCSLFAGDVFKGKRSMSRKPCTRGSLAHRRLRTVPRWLPCLNLWFRS